MAEKIRNNSLEKDPKLRAPLKSLVPVTWVAALYCSARAYIVLEDIINLRSLPVSTFAFVSWTEFIPHF